MTFVPENDLERALMRAPNEPAARPEFYRLLLDSPLLALGDMHDGKMGLVQTAFNGHDYHLAFTSLTRLQAFITEEKKSIQMRGRDLFSAARGAYFWLNAGSDYGKELLPEELAHILAPNASKPVAFDSNTPMLISQPKEPPRALMDALAAMFRQRPDVRAAYLAQVSYQGAMEPHPLIGVETDGDWNALDPEIGRVVAGLGTKMTVDAVQIGDGSAIGDDLRKNPPFYRRAN